MSEKHVFYCDYCDEREEFPVFSATLPERWDYIMSGKTKKYMCGWCVNECFEVENHEIVGYKDKAVVSPASPSCQDADDIANTWLEQRYNEIEN